MTVQGRAVGRWLGMVLLLPLLALAPSTAFAQSKLKAVATFSILGDLVREVGGDRVAVTSLVGPNADAHGYNPTPSDARALAQADIVVVNGLGFEGWIERLIKASGTKAKVVIASEGVRSIEHDHAQGHAQQGHAQQGHTHDEEGHDDPHAWQSVPNVKLYVEAIRAGLTDVDPAYATLYAANAKAYSESLDALDAEVRATITAIPEARRRVITSHDSFRYFTNAYGLDFMAAQGLSTSAEPGPADIARIIRQIRRDKIPAVFLETIADPRLMQQIARESGARIGGKVFSDALSSADGPAPTYIRMMQENLRALREALG